MKYAFIKQQAADYSVRRLCLTLKIHPSGYYAWLSEPQSARAKDDQRLLGLIKHSWLESGAFMAIAKSMMTWVKSVRLAVAIGLPD